MSRLIAAALAAAAAAHVANAGGVTPLVPALRELAASAAATTPKHASPREIFGHLLAHADVKLRATWDAASDEEREAAKAEAVSPIRKGIPAGSSMTDYPNPLPGPEWRWVPEFMDAVVPNGPAYTFAGACFANNTATAAYTSYGVRVTLVASNQVREE